MMIMGYLHFKRLALPKLQVLNNLVDVCHCSGNLRKSL